MLHCPHVQQVWQNSILCSSPNPHFGYDFLEFQIRGAFRTEPNIIRPFSRDKQPLLASLTLDEAAIVEEPIFFRAAQTHISSFTLVKMLR